MGNRISNHWQTAVLAYSRGRLSQKDQTDQRNIVCVVANGYKYFMYLDNACRKRSTFEF